MTRTAGSALLAAAAITDAARRCTTCTRTRTPRGVYVCDGCTDRARRDLAAIPALYARLDGVELAPGQQRRDDGRQVGGHASRPPLRLEPLALGLAPDDVTAGRAIDTGDLDVDVLRGAPDSPTRARDLPTLTAVGRVADRCREDGLLAELEGRRSVHRECAALESVLDAVAGRWWGGRVLRELGETAAALRTVLEGRATTVPVGQCPGRVAVLVADEHGTRPASARCEGTVRVRDGVDARCTRCTRSWHGELEVRRLAALLGDAYLDAAALGEHLSAFRPEGGTRPTVDVLRQWAHRDGWGTRPSGRRTTYRVADALASAARRWGLSDLSAAA